MSDTPRPAKPEAEPFPVARRERLREQIMADPDLDCEVRPSASNPWPPCPFCGSTNLFKRTTVSPVSCGHCGAEGPAADCRARWESRAERDALRKGSREAVQEMHDLATANAKRADAAEAERDVLRAAIRSALCEYDHSREDAAEVRQEMGRILRAADNPE